MLHRPSALRPPISALAALALLTAAAATATLGTGCRRPYGGGENTPTACSNGIDDDGNGYIDCADSSCFAYCAAGTDAGGGSTDGGGAACGDGICSVGESCISCEDDCGVCPPGCGDGTCAGSETCTSCDLDCGTCPAVCGDTVCDPVEEDCTDCPVDCGTCPAGCPDGACAGGETCSTCPADCGSCCGNGVCSGGETCSSCASDCGSCCGNGTCSGGETCSTCPGDCGVCPPTCGNGTCAGGETCTSCPADCGLCCGNGVCSGTETCSTCVADCGPCGSTCGDGACTIGETCSSCASDCGIFGTSISSDSFYELCRATTGASLCPDVVGGTTVAMGDDTTSLVSIGFSFPFYGSTYTTVNVSSNGRLSFGLADTEFANACLSSTSPATDVFAFWDDLNGVSGGITHNLTGPAGDRVFEVEWLVPHYMQPDNVEVRALLYEATGLITVCYVDTTSGTFTSGTSATTGIHGTGADFVQNSCNATVTAGNVAYYMPL